MLIRRHVVLLGLILAIAVIQMPTALWAQAKKDTTKDKSKDRLKFEVYQDASKEYRWRLVTGDEKDSKVLATGGQGYKAKSDCLHGVEIIKKGSSDKLNFEVYEDKGSDYRWRAKSSNGQVVASSGLSYKSKADCEKAVELVKKGVGKASTKEVKEAKS